MNKEKLKENIRLIELNGYVSKKDNRYIKLQELKRLLNTLEVQNE